ncbi:hypothetical protein H310_14301 [Aphanomyces invadans]|uniref:Myb-like domain-containing protein n=1 Tax=Aphanomyces invadans TaxID=157072 RepID=A0A024TCB6_9STRA|nr:hypothetical protein H310_14301 [Aphanomyces invadans]ETV90957.1 hypothetical protein H310_14301 [Aphanomyces invadans]|eukprot:XP_008880346.1 hypothetical protein H310_14301 [Aphanomyces invadans]
MVVDSGGSSGVNSSDNLQELQEKKWWLEDDDVMLLTQINNDRPFMQRKDAMKAWEALAATLRSHPSFSRRTLDGRKAQNRFLLLIRQHKSSSNASARLSGVSEDESAKTRLLDDIMPLYQDSLATKRRQIDADTKLDAAATKAADVKFIRHQAMLRGRRQSTSDSDGTDSAPTGKRKMVLEAQELEIALEREKLAFKKAKFEREMEERKKDRIEREKEREERQQIRDIGNQRHEEMMKLVLHLLQNR